MLKVNCPSELVVRAFMAVPAESRRRMRAPTTGACDTLSNTTPVRVWARAGTTSAKRIVVIRIERSTILIHRNQKGGAFPFAAPTASYRPFTAPYSFLAAAAFRAAGYTLT